MPDHPTAKPAPSKAQVFLRRLMSSLILWGVVIAALFSPNAFIARACFLTVMVALAAIGQAEFYGLVKRRGLACYRGTGLAFGIVLVASTWLMLSGVVQKQTLPAKAHDFETGIVVLCFLGLCVRRFLDKRQSDGVIAVATTLLGLLYVPWLLNFIQKIHFFPRADGTWYLIYFILVTKFSDMGAYATGSLIGRHKMIPRISPGKTWEGFGGALLFSMVGSLVFAHFAGKHLAGMTPVHAVVLGLLLGAAAVLGDLIESLFKREAGAKDSGRLFPGIGGILDLLDSLLFNAPLMYLYLRHALTN
ncbi:MAG: CDP-archaeol synthase [Verrucomicrobiae bacterium]|nr:CDP-archaeol synthase [Verrucomicrobiae bacterium]MCP5521955.1 CDP-archaeol synthase [Verrucomicrobiales bacterium]